MIPLQAICYVSSAVTPFSPEDIDVLLRQSRDRNALQEITGLLLYCDGNFMQYIEGPPSGLQPIWESIQRDAKHHGVILLFRELVPERLFQGWSMAFSADQPPEFAAIRQDLGKRQDSYATADRALMIRNLLQNFWKQNWSRD